MVGRFRMIILCRHREIMTAAYVKDMFFDRAKAADDFCSAGSCSCKAAERPPASPTICWIMLNYYWIIYEILCDFMRWTKSYIVLPYLHWSGSSSEKKTGWFVWFSSGDRLSCSVHQESAWRQGGRSECTRSQSKSSQLLATSVKQVIKSQSSNHQQIPLINCLTSTRGPSLVPDFHQELNLLSWKLPKLCSCSRSASSKVLRKRNMPRARSCKEWQRLMLVSPAWGRRRNMMKYDEL